MSVYMCGLSMWCVVSVCERFYGVCECMERVWCVVSFERLFVMRVCVNVSG